MNSAFVGYQDNTLLGLLNSSYPTQPHSLIAKYSYLFQACFRLGGGWGEDFIGTKVLEKGGGLFN